MSNPTRGTTAGSNAWTTIENMFFGAVDADISMRVENAVNAIPIRELSKMGDAKKALSRLFSILPKTLAKDPATQPLILSAIATAVERNQRFPRLVRELIPGVLRGIDQAAASKLTDLFDKDDAGVSDWNEVVENLFSDPKKNGTAPGEACCSTRDGGNLHRTGMCPTALTENQMTGSVEELFERYPHRGLCPICFRTAIAAGTITVEAKKEEAKKPSIVDALAADAGKIGADGDKHIARSLHLFELLLSAGNEGLLRNLGSSRHLQILHQKSLVKDPSVVRLIPDIPQTEINLALQALNTLRAHPEAVGPRQFLDRMVVDLFGAYIAQIRIVGDANVADPIEAGLMGLDLVVTNAPSSLRESFRERWRNGTLTRNITGVLSFYAGAFLGSRLAAMLSTFALKVLMGGSLLLAFVAGALVYLPAAWDIVWNTPSAWNAIWSPVLASDSLLLDIQTVFLGWGIVFTSTLVWGLVDTVPRALGNAIRGTIPDGASPMARLVGELIGAARRWLGIPQTDAVTAPPAEGESQWWRQTGYTISFVTSLVSVILFVKTIATVCIDMIAYLPTVQLGMSITTIMLITTVTWIAIWLLRYVSPMTPNEWKKWALEIYDMQARKADWNKAKNYFLWTLMAVAVLFVATSGVCVVLGAGAATLYYTVDGDNVAYAHEELKASIGEAIGNPKYSGKSASTTTVASTSSAGKPSYCGSFPSRPACN